MSSCKVQSLQETLSRVAKQSPDRRFGALYDKIYRKDVLLMAWKRVRRNKGAPGLDEEDFEYIEEEIGVENFLQKLEDELRDQTYRPLPVLRCWIEKPGKSEKRGLGIPVIRDRVCQMATKIVIEPIFETNFLNCSYGFRSGRSAHDAIEDIKRTITFEGIREVVDVDIKGCFDNISHSKLIRLIQRRISDPRILRLIRMWLKAGIMVEGTIEKPDGLGTPQGSVISPLLCNIYLHCFDKLFHLSGCKGRLVRYADDMVVLLRDNGKRGLALIKRLLARLDLQVNPEKTRVVHVRKGCDFLGIHMRLCRVHKPKSRIRFNCRNWPSNRSMIRIREKLREKIVCRFNRSLPELIDEINPLIRGWNNYHTRVYTEKERFSHLNNFVYDRIRKFQRWKYNDDSRSNRRLPGNLLARLGLCQFG